MKHLAVYILLFLTPLYSQTVGFETIPFQELQILNQEFRERIQSYRLREGNGDIVGNGAGLAELNMAYVYRSIPSFVDRYLSSAAFNLSPSDKAALVAIRNIAQDRETLSDVFEFVEEADLFLLFPEESQRIALTGFSPEFPIYINKTLLYQTSGLAENLPMLASILIHELGHQAGIRSHKYLDYLGAAVQSYLEKRFSVHSLDMGGKLSVNILNRAPDDYATPQVFITYRDNSVDITNILRAQAVCPDAKAALAFDIRNAHWERPQTNASARFNFWSKLICPHKGTTRSYERDYSIRIGLPELEAELLELY